MPVVFLWVFMIMYSSDRRNLNRRQTGCSCAYTHGRGRDKGEVAWVVMGDEVRGALPGGCEWHHEAGRYNWLVVCLARESGLCRRRAR